MRLTRDDFWRMIIALKDEGGFTWDLVFNEIIEDVWMIGGASHELIIKKDALKSWQDMDLIILLINDFIEETLQKDELILRERSKDDTSKIRFNAIGGWIDEKGDLIIEISQGVKDTMEAIRLGIKRHQKSIYHLKRGELISIDEIKALIGIYHDLREDKK